ncbi:MAG TPA: hypothetical protein VEE83_00820 [Thermoplasmata archaeon]|nr:hypothetical protein [Thermoplasmata archaeon]
MPIPRIDAAMALSPLEAAEELGDELLEVLKQLNRSENEAGTTSGLEVDELHHILGRGPLPRVSGNDVARAVDVLVGNGLARCLDAPEYSWERGRVVAARYVITSQGKAYLLSRLSKTGRVE